MMRKQQTVKKDNSRKSAHQMAENDYQRILTCWDVISPFWTVDSLIATNPLSGFEHRPFEQAVKEAAYYFQTEDLPAELQTVNRLTIKWCKAYFDTGQAAINMPFREQGFLAASLKLIIWDKQLHNNNPEKLEWIRSLEPDANNIIVECLKRLKISYADSTEFLKLILTTLPGWSSHVKYLAEWDSTQLNKQIANEYLAVRLIITYLLWPEASSLLMAANQARPRKLELPKVDKEELYIADLIKKLTNKGKNEQSQPPALAQLVFCIDVRSEPIRRQVELIGNYETYGFAGFFGLPITIHNRVTSESYASCPVLLKPSDDVYISLEESRIGKLFQWLSSAYNSLKFTFTAPFALVEALGPVCGFKMFVKNFLPRSTKAIEPPEQQAELVDISHIPSGKQLKLAESALTMMGLTSNFAPLVVLCGHGGQTQNNPFASSLNCGACGGHEGGLNARTMALILNQPAVRSHLSSNSGINIPEKTLFIGASHNTTNDDIKLHLDQSASTEQVKPISHLRKDLDKASEQNRRYRETNLAPSFFRRDTDWAQVRPEWGLARNASFIVAPREWTKGVDLEGRAFLHSYDWRLDPEGVYLTTILTAPMVVAQWINCQYIFSSIDNVAFGAGSKITTNITGRHGIMQGNASDLYTGLPLQSVYSTDDKPYHDPLRLLTVVHAPRELVLDIILKSEKLKSLFGNQWVNMVCHDPLSGYFRLSNDFSWVDNNDISLQK